MERNTSIRTQRMNGIRLLKQWNESKRYIPAYSGNAGLEAEREVIEILKNNLPSVKIFHQLRIPFTSSSAEMDVIALTPRCVYFIESKNWKNGVEIFNGNLIQPNKNSTKPYPLQKLEDISNQFKQIITTKTGSIIQETKSIVVLAHRKCIYESKELENKVILIDNLIDFINKEEDLREEMDSEIWNHINQTLSELPTWDALILANGDTIYGEIEQDDNIPALLNRKSSITYSIIPTSQNWIYNFLFGFTLEAVLPENQTHSVIFRNPERQYITVKFPWGGSRTVPLIHVRRIEFGWQNQFVWTPQVLEKNTSVPSKIRDKTFHHINERRLEIGQEIIGKVCRIFDYGVLVAISENMAGLIQLSDFDMAEEIFDAFIKVGVQIKTRVLNFEHSKKIDLKFLGVV